MDSAQPSGRASATVTPNQALQDISEPIANPPEPPPTLSKNAHKRLLKEKKREEFKHERRAREKAAKAAKREQAASATSTAGLTVRGDVNVKHEEKVGDWEGGGGPATKKRKLVDGEALAVRGDGGASDPGADNATRPIRKERFGARVVIDLGFDDKMTDRVSLPSPSSLIDPHGLTD
jgi:hypothetical protein